MGRVTDVDSSDGVSSDFSYNDQNSIAGYSVTKNNTVISKADYTYNDTSGLLTGVTTDNGTYNSFSYTYDGLNRLSTSSHSVSGSTMNTIYAYSAGTNSDTTGLVGVIVYIKGSNAFMPPLGYTYDNNGNIATVSKNSTIHITYTYDSLNRLVREDNKDLNKTVTYTYDERGNILNKKTYAYTTGSLTNATVTDTVTYSYNSTWKDKLVSFDGQSISYDSIGNPTAYRGASLTWEKGRQLKSYATSSKTLNFKYNAEGLRTEKKVGSTTYSYTWASGLLMQQSDGTNTLNFSYSPDGRPLAVKFNGTNYYYIYNLQGDVIGLYNTSGTVVVQYTYDSWGVLLSTTGSLASTLGALNPFRYRGYIYDEETELYWLRSRYYDPETGRFLNADVFVSTGQGINALNMFAYCGNNPVINIDITGTRYVKGIDACGGAGNYKTIQKNEYSYGTTFSIGGTWGYTKGQHSYSESYVVSTAQDTIAIQNTTSDGLSTGVGASAGIVITLTDANNVFDLEGASNSVGVTIVKKNKGIGIEYMEFNPPSNPDVLCRGISFIIPIGAEIEIHEYNNKTKTRKHWKTPIVKILENILS